MTAERELERLEREIVGPDRETSLSKPAQLLPSGKQAKSCNGLDLILALAAVLAIVGVGVNTVRQMPSQQAKSLQDGLIGGAAGLLVGYAVGRFQP